MSEDAALFWETDHHPTTDPGAGSIGPTIADRAILVPEEIIPGTTT